MKSMLKRILCMVVVFGLLVTLVPIQAYATSFANNSVEPANYSSAVTSVVALTERLESLIAKYKNTYWTSTGSACSAHGTGYTCYSKYYYGWQCKGFASYIFNDLFCGGYIGAYDSGYYYIPSPSNATLIGKYTDVSSTDGTTVQNLLSQAKPGDFIQAHRRGKSYGHSMIVTSVDSNGVYLFDCNSDGHCKVQHYYQTWSTFASKNDDFSLYRSTKYPSGSGGSTGSTTSHTANSAYSSCLPIYSYPISTGSITVYDVNGSAYSNRYITGSTDLCIIREIYTDGWCYVSYPSSAESDGYFEAYVPLTTFISSPPSSLTSWTSTGSYTAYRRSDLAATIGSVSSGDSCKVVATSGNLKQVIYPVTSSGYWKMGWINVGSTATTTDSDFPTPILAYNYSADTKTTVYQYTSTLGGTSYGTIFVDDLCTLNSVSISGNWVNVTYPVSSGTKTGYVYLNQFFPSLGNISKPYSTKVSANTTAYRKADMATSIGTVYPSDTITVVGKSGNLYQVLYPVTTGTNAGKYKLGWIYGDNIVKNLVSIAVTTKPTKTVYLEGESFSSSGMVVTATYDDGSTAAVTGYTVSGYTSTPGSKTITITYGGKTTAIDVTVNSKSPTALSITTKPTDTSYFVGEDFNTSGMVVKATYNNGTTANVTDYYVSYDFSSAGTKTVTVSYKYNGVTVSTTLSVTVVNPTISSIAVATKPTKTSYYVGDTLNTSGLTLTASYNDGSTETVSSGFTCSPTTLSTAGTQTITVSYGGKTTTFTVTVTAVTLSSISVATKPTKTSYYVGDTLNTSGLTLKATYNNGTSKTISSGFTCSPTSLSTAGTQTITVSYGGKSTTFTVTVNTVTLSSISIASNPTKTSYAVGDTLDTTGLILTATYNNGTTETVSSGFTCTPTSLDTAGTQKITVSYGGMTTSFNVEVLEIPSVSFTVGEVCGNPGETIRIPVSLTSNEGIIAARLKISYPSVLTLEKVEDCGILGEYVFGNDLTANPYIVMWENGLATSDYTETGVLAYLTFSISEDATAGAYDIEISYDEEEIYNIDLTNADVTISNGSVLVGHDCVQGSVTQPTCTEQGYTTYACTKCDYTYQDNFVEALGHTEVIDEAVFSGCNEPYLTEGSHCSVCGEVLIAQVYRPATGHDYRSGVCIYCGEADPDYSTTTTVASGWSGDLTWVLTDNGVLTFSGTGAMKNYTYKSEMPWYSYMDQITSVVIESGATRIGSYAFYGMTELESIEIPETVTAIGDYAFKNATAIDDVVLPSALSSLGDSAFYGCTSLTSIDIPASLYTVKPYTFKNCTALAEVTFHEGNLMKLSDGAFYGTALTEVAFPACLDIIDVYCFKNCSDLASITIPEGDLTQIREAVFYGTAIPSITIPEGVTKVGPYAFKNCVNLETVSLPTTLTSVGEASFYACTALKSMDIPDAVTTIGNYAFRRCTAMTSVTFGSELTDIGESSFYGCTGLTSLEIPDKVITIQGYAFKGCTGVTAVSLGSSVTTIGESAFHTCTAIKTIEVPASVETIGAYCFSGSYNLWQITFEGAAPSIGSSAFKGLAATAYYPADDSSWTSDVMQNYGGTITWKTTDGNTMEDDSTEDTVVDSGTCGDDLTWSLDTNGVLTISGTGKMKNYDQISTTIPDNAEDIATLNYSPWLLHRNSITKVVIEEGVTSIGKHAFYDYYYFTELELPDTLVNIYEAAFYGCANVAELDIPEYVEYIGKYAFMNWDALTAVVVPDSVTTFDQYVFARCELLASVKLSSNLTSIPAYTFLYCEALTELEIPSSVTTIGYGAFYGCNGLEALTIPASVTKLGNKVFYVGATSEITFLGDAPTFSSETFSSEIMTVYYPANNSTWTEDIMQNYGGTVTWVAVDENGNAVTTASEEAATVAAEPEEAIPEETEEVTEPEETVEEETVPEETVAEETLPAEIEEEETQPEETVEEETVSDETVPSETESTETVPEETVMDEVSDETVAEESK